MEVNKLILIAPTRLTDAEANFPLQAIVSLFDIKGSEYYKTELWELLKSIMRFEGWSYLNDPSLALWLIENLGKFIDALWLMLHDKELKDGQIVLPDLPVNGEEKGAKHRQERVDLYTVLNLYRGRVRRLTMDEIENPMLTVKDFFTFHDLQQWKNLLQQWQEYSLRQVSITFENDETTHLILLEYEYLEKIIEVAFLLNAESEKGFYIDRKLFLEGIVGDFRLCTDKKVTIKMVEDFIKLMDGFPLDRLSRNLRKATLELVNNNIKLPPDYFSDLVSDVNQLTAFLDMSNDEIRTAV